MQVKYPAKWGVQIVE
ncbi:DUF6783 domain-containing protein [Blautia wexlerae]